MTYKSIAFVGAGFASSVLARELVTKGKFKVKIYESRSHIAGNCHTSRENGIMLHHYGPHIFNTSRIDVWNYISQYSEMYPFVNRVKAVTSKGVYSLPINLLTINQFFGKKFTPSEARKFIDTLGAGINKEPSSFEEQALKFIGKDLYEAFFYGYTKKQWGVDPKNLPADILKRLPVRFDYNDNYYNQKYQGMPVEGYTAIVEKILDHPNIDVHLNKPFNSSMQAEFDHVFCSGPMDAYFGYKFGRLKYRSLVFEKIESSGDYQGNAVINYCEEKVPYTRISEHKHFSPWEDHKETICFREYSKFAEENDVPYYPMRLSADKEMLLKYRDLAKSNKGLTFIGRLGTYRYLDMHVVIGESLDLSKKCLGSNLESWPAFSNEEYV